MTGELGYSVPPAIRRISTNFRLVGWVSLWSQVVIGVISSLLFIVNALEPDKSLSNAGADVFQAVGIAFVFASAFWGFRYVRMGRKLRTSNPDLRPKPKDAAQAVRLGLLISLVGMFVTIIAAESIVALLWLRALRQVATFGGISQDTAAFINAADIAVVFSVVNTMFAHFLGLCASLWLQYVIDRQ
ncbi:MAG: DUF3611 family protein [Cyanobacteria bacterium P01_F01_bin.53]